MNTRDRFRGCLLGLAVGDAVGTAVEFKPRGSFPPVNDMTGGGPFGLQPGQWTDDTSMALCLAASLVETGRFDARDQMRRYCDWQDHGYLSSTGTCFDIGVTVSQALRRFRETGNPFSGSPRPDSAGNGSIMRLAPVVLRYAPDLARAAHYAAESSRTTHAAAECLDACRWLAVVLVRALAGEEKERVLFTPSPVPLTAPKIQALSEGRYRTKTASAVRGSGYVVASLEAALWCFWTTPTFEAAILRAANLGEDADTTAAVCGQIAGAHYGSSGIPAAWLARLAQRDLIQDLADRLLAQSPGRDPETV